MQRLVVGVSGSSAPQLAYTLLQALHGIDSIETHLVLTRGAELSIKLELGMSAGEFEALADVVHDATNLAAPISSGSFRTAGMVVIPCSMKTLASFASCFSVHVVLRSADVWL
jgi:polyprenyl P-hydroxybenzoate/phenylacrylic acid decarboxylase-like protein